MFFLRNKKLRQGKIKPALCICIGTKVFLSKFNHGLVPKYNTSPDKFYNAHEKLNSKNVENNLNHCDTSLWLNLKINANQSL